MILPMSNIHKNRRKHIQSMNLLMKKGTLKKITLPSVIACNRWRQLKAGILTHAVTFHPPSRTECNGYGIQLHVHSSTTVQDFHLIPS